MERADGSVPTRSPEFAGVLSLSPQFEPPLHSLRRSLFFFSLGRLIVVSVFKMDPAFTENEAADE